MAEVGRPGPAEYQPPLTAWGHAWRLLAMAAIAVFVWLTIAERLTPERFVLDVVLGVLALGLVWFRRRRPFPVAVGTVLLSIGSPIAAGPASLASVSLATRRNWLQVVAIGILNVAAALAFGEVHPPSNEEPFWLTFATNVVFTVGMLAVGMYIGSRRELLWTLRQRAERAEAEQELRATQARLEERGSIAREMHDVLAHRISQISMRAGALTYREDLTPAEMRDGVTVIREAANQALDDLRGVLGVLRDGDGVLHSPQPTYADLHALVEDARATGLRIEYADGVRATHRDREEEADGSDGTPVVPDAAGRTLYRIVQEGITNARKHAPGADLSIHLDGSPQRGIDVVMRNPLGFGPGRTPGAGLGLIGLAERAALSGGRIEHGPADGTFVLRAWIPWTA